MPEPPPDHVTALARQRSDARAAGDFESADGLRSEIEAAGWKVIDVGHDFRLEPAHRPDVERGGVTHYGSSATVPSRLNEPASASATVVLVAGPDLDALDSNVAALQPAVADGTQVVVVAVTETPDDDRESRLRDLAPPLEIIWLASDIGLAGCWNAGIRRAAGSVVVLVAPAARLRSDVARELAAALADDDVAVVGSAGLRSDDLRHWESASGPDVDAVDAEVLAFRRADALARGPLDERFATPHLLAIWWSLVLRDAGQDEPARGARAVQLPVEPVPAQPADERDRASRRDFYRIVDRFGRRYDLLRQPVKPTAGGTPERRR